MMLETSDSLREKLFIQDAKTRCRSEEPSTQIVRLVVERDKFDNASLDGQTGCLIFLQICESGFRRRLADRPKPVIGFLEFSREKPIAREPDTTTN